jgi:hypothetical protein
LASIKSQKEPHACAIIIKLYVELSLGTYLTDNEWLTSTIVRSTEDSDQCPVVPELVSIFYDHVCTTNQIHVVPRKEFVDDALSEAVTNTSLIVFPVYRGIRWI